MIGIGLIAGLLITTAATRVLSSQLFGISSYDPFTLASVVAVVGIAGLAACYFPARRATEVDPVVALRYE